jgi:hypothetical protein
LAGAVVREVVGADTAGFNDAVGAGDALSALLEQVAAVGGLPADLFEVAAVDEHHDGGVALLPGHAAPASRR